MLKFGVKPPPKPVNPASLFMLRVKSDTEVEERVLSGEFRHVMERFVSHAMTKPEGTDFDLSLEHKD